jgi:hypothetical protein
MLQPWVSSAQSNTIDNPLSSTVATVTGSASPIAAYQEELIIAVQDLWLVGLDRADQQHLQQWQ